MKSRRSNLRFVRVFAVETDFTRFEHLSALLDTAIKPAQQALETFAFPAFHIYHTISPSFL